MQNVMFCCVVTFKMIVNEYFFFSREVVGLSSVRIPVYSLTPNVKCTLTCLKQTYNHLAGIRSSDVLLFDKWLASSAGVITVTGSQHSLPAEHARLS